MGDRVKCKCVLVRRAESEGADSLYLAIEPDLKLRILPCRPEGMPKREEESRPEWQYCECGGGQLTVFPSLLATDTGFHTDYNWSCSYVATEPGESAYERFYAENPEISK